MSDLDYDALQKVAEAATPGPWRVCESPEWHENDLPDQVICGDEHVSVAILADEWYEDEDGEPASADDARYIATFNPDVIARLLDLAQRAEADRAAVERVRALADEAQPAISHGPADCKNTCWDGACTCSGIPRPLGWTLDPEAIRAALDREEDQ